MSYTHWYMSTPLEPLTPERRRRQTRDHLLAAAAQVFAERGFHGASLDQVAAAAGFSKGAVYSNFASKEDLFLALLEWVYATEMAATRQVIESSEVPPQSRLGDFLPLLLGAEADLPEGWGALRLEFTLYALRHPRARQRLVELNDAAISATADLITAQRVRWGMPGIDSPERVARVIEALFEGIGVMRTLNPDAVDRALMETAIGFVSQALTAEP